MKRKWVGVLIVAFLLMPGLVQAVTEKEFEVKTTQDLINLCTASPDDPMRDKAIHFCHGFLVGAFQYYSAENAGPEGKRLVCFPDPAPSRNDAIRMFIEWAKAHPQFMGEKPVETEFRFLMETWPCKK